MFLLDARISRWATRLVRSFGLSEPSRRRVEPEPGDVLFCPSFWHEVDPAIYLRVREQGCAVVLLVHDILPITHPGFYPFPWREQFRDRIIAAFGYATAFLCVSETTRRSLADFALAQNKTGDLQVAYNGYQPVGGDLGRFAVEARPDFQRVLDCPVRPLLMVGSIEPKKDYVRVIELLEKRWNDGYERPLVIVGQPGWLSDQIIRRIRHSPRLGRMLYWFHDLEDLGSLQRVCALPRVDFRFGCRRVRSAFDRGRHEP